MRCSLETIPPKDADRGEDAGVDDVAPEGVVKHEEVCEAEMVAPIMEERMPMDVVEVDEGIQDAVSLMEWRSEPPPRRHRDRSWDKWLRPRDVEHRRRHRDIREPSPPRSKGKGKQQKKRLGPRSVEGKALQRQDARERKLSMWKRTGLRVPMSKGQRCTPLP